MDSDKKVEKKAENQQKVLEFVIEERQNAEESDMELLRCGGCDCSCSGCSGNCT